MFFYNTFGFTLSSPFPIPHLIITTKSTQDITIIDSDFSAPKSWNPEELFHPDPENNELIINLKGEPYIKVRKGKEIVVNSNIIATPQEREVLILASGLAAILIQRDFLLIHGASVLHNDEVIAFLGPKGIGKSTLTAGLLERGYNALGDDICAIYKNQSGQFHLLCPPSTLKLTEDTIAKLSIQTAEENKHCDLKYWLKLPQTEINNYPLTKIYILQTADITETTIKPLRGIVALEKILENLYRPAVVNGLRKWKTNFDLLGQIASNLAISELTRPVKQFELDNLLDKIESEILT